MDRLPSKKRSMREATLAWLESAARTREPEYLQLSSHTELLPVLKAAQDSAVCPCAEARQSAPGPSLAALQAVCFARSFCTEEKAAEVWLIQAQPDAQ